MRRLDALQLTYSLLKQSKCLDHLNIRIFAFGSCVQPVEHIADVDLVVLYESATDLPSLKRELERLELSMPLHIIYLSTTEEEQFDFLSEQRAIHINAIGRVTGMLYSRLE
jgi:hypothetical protein